MSAGPRFSLHFMSRTLVGRVSMEITRRLNGRRFVVGCHHFHIRRKS